LPQSSATSCRATPFRALGGCRFSLFVRVDSAHLFDRSSPEGRPGRAFDGAPWLATSRGRPPPAFLLCSLQRGPCSSRFRSLLRLAGKSGPGVPNSTPFRPDCHGDSPRSREFPVSSLLIREVGPGDGLARDWLHRQPVCWCRDFASAPGNTLRSSRDSAGFWRLGSRPSEPEMVVCSQYSSTLILLTFSTAHPQRDGCAFDAAPVACHFSRQSPAGDCPRRRPEIARIPCIFPAAKLSASLSSILLDGPERESRGRCPERASPRVWHAPGRRIQRRQDSSTMSSPHLMSSGL
jgi:hypothetical protein